jgi:chorismate mutase
VEHAFIYRLDILLLHCTHADYLIGKFVSESKFSSHPSDFIPHILNPNRAALEALITKPEVERALLARLRKKATLYARELDMQGEPAEAPSEGSSANETNESTPAKGKFRVDVEVIEELYEKYIIPLTKEVEVINPPFWHQSTLKPLQVDYLLQRLDGISEAEIKSLGLK